MMIWTAYPDVADNTCCLWRAIASRQGSAKRGLFRASISIFYLPNDRGVSVGKYAERERAVDSERD